MHADNDKSTCMNELYCLSHAYMCALTCPSLHSICRYTHNAHTAISCFFVCSSRSQLSRAWSTFPEIYCFIAFCMFAFDQPASTHQVPYHVTWQTLCKEAETIQKIQGDAQQLTQLSEPHSRQQTWQVAEKQTCRVDAAAVL